MEDFYDKTRQAFLGGQKASTASDGSGIRILYRCHLCQRVWLQDGKAAILDLKDEQIKHFASVLHANLHHLPHSVCRICLWFHQTGAVSIDEYSQGESFGFCWEIPQPIVIHAISAIQSKKGAEQWESRAGVLTQTKKLLAILSFLKDAPLPQPISELSPIFGQMQAAQQRPGFGQTGTERWKWHVWSFSLPCPELDADHDSVVTFTLALPQDELVSPIGAFHIWQLLLDCTLRSGIVEGRL
jgi:hypothetical protein